jgi:DNA helicase-2/ATP-dependent DNA helicase PcrA
MAWNDGLQGVSLAIAGTLERPLRVIAGPGTGKTFALKRMVARLLNDGAEPERILVVTFTRASAADLRRELGAMDVDGVEDVHAGTLHSFCFSLLSQNEVFGYLQRKARPLVTFQSSGILRFEAEPMLHDLNDPQFGGRRDRTKRIRAFEAAWGRLQSDEPGWPEDPIDRSFHAELIRWLQFHEAILIGELIPETLRYLRDNPGCAARAGYDHVVVDEYQDLNRAEQVLLDLLANQTNQVVVGDPDQSIYSFLRFAHPEGINNFGDTHAGTHDEALVECRRCPQRVVAIADHLIQHNHIGEAAVRLAPAAANVAGDIHIVQWESLNAEASGLAEYVGQLRARGVGLGEILILSPRRQIGYEVRDAILAMGIPVHSFYHEEALEEEHAQRSFCLLTLLARSDDRVALRFWLGMGSPTMRWGEYGRLREYCEESGVPPFDALDGLIAGTIDIDRTNGIQERYRDLLAELERLRALDVQELIDDLFPDGNAEVAVLRESAASMQPPPESARELLDSLRSTVTQPEIPETADFVRVMSLHKSKGLTSRVVIVTGCVQGLIPSLDETLTPADAQRLIEEQRRLFYVAITRPREILVLSSASRIPRRAAHRIGAVVMGADRAVTSRFIGELGPDAPRPVTGRQWRENGFRKANQGEWVC